MLLRLWNFQPKRLNIVARLNQKVNMIGHQAVRKDLDLIDFLTLTEYLQIILEVLLPGKDYLSVVTPLDDVAGIVRQHHTTHPWHVYTSCLRSAAAKYYTKINLHKKYRK